MSNILSRRELLVTAAVAGFAPLAAIGAESAVPAGAITAVTLIHGIPRHEEELKAHLLSLALPTRAERGCLRYDLYQSPAQSHEFMRFEIWASAADLDTHKQSPHLRASFAKRQREGWTTEILTWQPVHE